MAQLPVPRRARRARLSIRHSPALRSAAAGATLSLSLPAGVRKVLARLADTGHEAALVGGALRDLLLDGAAIDWDVTTSAEPQQVVALFADATWENRFGTVTVHTEPAVQVTTYRSERGYRDRRRPDEVSWGSSLPVDLARRDFTINAIAWIPTDVARGEGRLVDPFGGIDDLRGGLLRAVGDPDARLAEDALRLLRAVRFARRFDLTLEPRTEAALRRNAGAAASLSGERVREELLRMLALPSPSAALGLMEELGLLVVLLPELADLRGVPQDKARRGDALDHVLRTADALPADDPPLRLAGLLHDVGKAPTLADGPFHGHERVGAEMAERILHRLRCSNDEIERLTQLVRHHMFGYTPDWTDAAVRRFVRRVGRHRLADLFALRRADDLASGAAEPASGGLAELERRIAELGSIPLGIGDLAVDGHLLQRELGIGPGPQVGALLGMLLERVIDEPALNERALLVDLARESLAEGGAHRHQHPEPTDPPG